MANIEVYNGSLRVAKTSKAFGATVTHELMRIHTLEFGVTKDDPSRKYIKPGATFAADGQKYDCVSYNKNTGTGNITIASGEHVSYRLLNYTLAAGYAYVGTVAEILADILDLSVDSAGRKASTEFSVGTTPDLGSVSLALNNTSAVTARYAVLALVALGVECDFDNFTINIATQINSGNYETLEFGVNLADISETWSRNNGTTYQISFADLQYVPGATGHELSLGDTVTLVDKYTGETHTDRVITYIKHLDDPSKNTIFLGAFVADTATAIATTDIKADNSVQQGEQYSNVSIDHTNGFMAVNAAGTLRVVMNSSDCFAVQVKDGEDWVTIQELTSEGLGATKLFNPDGEGDPYDSYAVIGDSGGTGQTKSFSLHGLWESGGILTDFQIFSVWALTSIVTYLEGNSASHNGQLLFTSLGAQLRTKSGGGRVSVSNNSVNIYGSDGSNETILTISPTAVTITRNGSVIQTW